MSSRILFPEFTVTAGPAEFRSGGHGEVWSLEVSRAVNGPADEAVLRLGRALDTEAVEPGETVEIDLGYKGALERVFTGTVCETVGGLGGWELRCLGSQRMLIETRVDRSFQAQSAGEIFQTLAGEAGVSVEQASSGVVLSSYLVDSTLNCWEHTLRLAFHGGCDIRSTGDGALIFAPLPAPGGAERLRFGADLIRVIREGEPPPYKPRYVPESPASSGGEDTWVAKDNSGAAAEAGEGAARTYYHPVMRTQEQAQIAADTHWKQLRRNLERMIIETVGRPALDLGDTVQIESLPGGGDGIYQVLAFEHRFDFRRGFRTLARLATAG